MPPDFPPKFGEEWGAERAEFYRGIFGPRFVDDGDDQILRLALQDLPPRPEPAPLFAAVHALAARSRKAAELLDHHLPPGHTDREVLGEVLSDCSLMLAYLADWLRPDGREGEVKLALSKRGDGRSADAATLRKQFRAAAAAEDLIASGVLAKVADSRIAKKLTDAGEETKPGTVKRWRQHRARIVAEMKKL